MHVSVKGNVQAFEMQSTIPRAEYSIQAYGRVCEAPCSICTGRYRPQKGPMHFMYALLVGLTNSLYLRVLYKNITFP